MKFIKGGVTAPKGFLANGLSSGVKRSGKLDLGIIVSEHSAVTAGVFTKSSIKAAPLLVSMKHIRKGVSRAVLVNSGIANYYTGETGLKHALCSTELVAKFLGVNTPDVLVASTGIIGKPLPYDKIAEAIPMLISGLSPQCGDKFARAIMTTDLQVKEIAVEINIGGKKVTIGGCAKGSGMIEPNMATMLGFITTDVAISNKMLKIALNHATQRSFNSITVDGCMSTMEILVIKYGGSILDDSRIRHNVLQDIVFLSSVGIGIIIVHGGGPHISACMEENGLKHEFVDGIRVTNKETLKIVDEELEKLNRQIISEIKNLNGDVTGLKSQENIIFVKKKKGARDLGFVGTITSINKEHLDAPLAQGQITVISPMGTTTEKQPYNVNADEVASAIANAMKAEKLVFMTDVCGVMRDLKDMSTIMSTLTLDEVDELIKSGVITGGMIPKVNSCVEALKGGNIMEITINNDTRKIFLQ